MYFACSPPIHLSLSLCWGLNSRPCCVRQASYHWDAPCCSIFQLPDTFSPISFFPFFFPSFWAHFLSPLFLVTGLYGLGWSWTLELKWFSFFSLPSRKNVMFLTWIWYWHSEEWWQRNQPCHGTFQTLINPHPCLTSLLLFYKTKYTPSNMIFVVFFFLLNILLVFTSLFFLEAMFCGLFVCFF